MSYPRDLDEYSNAELYAELERRRALTERACCSYCGRRGDTPPCKFPDRHEFAKLELQARMRHILTRYRKGFSYNGPRPASSEQIRALYKW